MSYPHIHVNSKRKKGPKKERVVIIVIVNQVKTAIWPVLRTGSTTFIDKAGVMVLPPIYKGVSPLFSNGLANVIIGHKYGFIDKQGAVVMPGIFDSAMPFVNGLSRVSLNGQYGYINLDGVEYWEN